MAGWIKLHRQIINDPIFKNPHLYKMWTWCLLKATHAPYIEIDGLEQIPLDAGEFITGRFKGSSELDINPSTFYKHLKTLEKFGLITVKSNNKRTTVSVVNWELYRNDKPVAYQQNNNEITTKEQQNNTNNNNKNNKNNKKDISNKKSNQEFTQEFEEWYENYPRQQAKKDTFKSFQKVKKEKGLDVILKATKNYIDFLDSKPKEEQPYKYAYSSNNFLGQKAYYLEFIEPKEAPNTEYDKYLDDLFSAKVPDFL